jgi:ABC-2 type transport system permease protein
MTPAAGQPSPAGHIMHSIHRVLLVARWEFRAAVMRRGFIVAVVTMPLLFFGIASMSVLTAPRTSSAAAGSIAIVDPANIVDIAFAAEQAALRDRQTAGTAATPLEAITTGATSASGPAGAAGAAAAAAGMLTAPPPSPLVRYDDRQQALDDLAAERLAAVYVIDAGYLQTGRIVAYGRELNVFGQGAANRRAAAVSDAIRASLLKGLDGQKLARAYAPAQQTEVHTVDKDGRIRDGADFGIGRFITTFGVFMLFTMAIFMSAGYLQQATVEDRRNRVFEVLLSSVDADHLILGKIAGLGGAGLLQVLIYVLLIVGTGSTALPALDLSWSQLALVGAYFTIGYLVFASLMAAVGMIARSPQEGAQLSAIWTLTASAPFFFMTGIVAAPQGVLSRTLSFFPLTSSVTMLMRLTMTGSVPVLDIVASLIIGVIAVVAALRGTVKIFRASTLMYGKRPTLPELIHWLRAA